MTALKLDVSRETSDRLAAFTKLVGKWTQRINLVSNTDRDDIWQRHVADSAQLYPDDPGPVWADLGSGGGFPAIVCAIIAAERHPATAFHLIESDQRKAVFLRTALREIDVESVVHSARIDHVSPLGAAFLTARALAALPRLLSYAERHLAPSGTACFPKGARVEDEISEAERHWRFDCRRLSSHTDPDATILHIRNISSAN